MALNTTAIASNTAGISQLSGLGQSITQIQNAVDANAQFAAQQSVQLSSNTNRISIAETNISNNSLAITENSSRITNNENILASQFEANQRAISGVAIALALPDAFLGNHENFAISGGVGLYGNETGFAANVIARGDYGWSFGAGVGTAGGEVGGKLQARWGLR